MNTSLQSAFNQCLAALERGDSLDRVLARFPQQADELRPLLLIAQRAMEESPTPPGRAAQLRSRTAMLSRANQLKTTSAAKTPLLFLRWGLATALVALFLIIASGFGLAVASAQALPGDDLYTVKRAAERIQLSLTTGRTNRLNLTIHQETLRIQEVQRLLALGRVAEVEFEAELDSKSGSLWQFGVVPVLMTEDTIVPNGLRVGDVIQVSGRTTTQGWVRAHRFSAAGLTFDGLIETIKSNQWIIDGRVVTILPSSILDPGLEAGDNVRVRARTEGEFLVAQQITAIEFGATPVPTIAPSNPESTASPEPTATNFEDDGDDLEQFDLTGRLEAKEGSRWRIEGRWIYLDGATELEGEFSVGATVRAKGNILTDGRYLAEELRQLESEAEEPEDEEDGTEEVPEDTTEEPEDEESEEPESDGTESPDDDSSDETVKLDFDGVVQSISSGQWVVGGKTLIITGDTRIDEDISLGDSVSVEAEQASDGTLYAEKIELDD